MFSDEDSCLYHGFLIQHRVSFTMYILSFTKSRICEGNESFYEVLEDDKKLLQQEDCDKYLLNPYLSLANYPGTEGNHPEKAGFLLEIVVRSNLSAM